MLTAIADALRLSRGERRHLFLLGGHADVEKPSSSEKVSDQLQGLLDSLSPHPAVVMNPSWEPLLGRIRQESPLFVRLWDQADVSTDPERVKCVRSLHVGKLSLHTITMLLQENPRTRVVVYRPEDWTTQERLEELANRIARGTVDGPANVRRLRPAT